MAAKIKKGDLVIVIAGKDKGKTGDVKSCLDNDRVIVSNINMVKKHVKGNPHQNTQGGIMEKESAIHISNVALFDKAAKKPSRVGFKTLADGKKVRFLKSNNETIDV